MVRVASLKDQVHAGYEKTDIAGMAQGTVKGDQCPDT